jgi:4,5-dihydroxyphthalate decarboxylase
MALNKVTLTVSDNDHFFLPILGRDVVPRGIELDLRKYEGTEPTSIRMVDLAYDVADVSLSTFVKARGDGAPLVALPVFTTRRFIQPHIHLRKNSDVRDLSQLKGKRVGLHLYWNSTAVWGRSIFWRMHGVAPRDIIWITNRPERLKNQGFPPGVEVQQDKLGRDTADLLVEGEVDAVIGLGPGGLPQAEGAMTGREKAERVRRPAYPDLLEAQRSYYRKTGVLPMTSVVVMREELATKEPWIVESLWELFQAAKRKYGVARALQELLPTGHSPLLGGTVKDVHDLLGEDPWPYNIRENRRALETLLAEALDQGLIRRPMTVESVFASNLPEAAR